MTPTLVAEVERIMKQICANARDALHRSGRITSAKRMSTDDFKALAKDVEEVGELVHQLETTNPHIVPALFEVPFGKWKGWSGLANYRNRLVHEFRKVTAEELLERVTHDLALREVVDLLETVTSVGMNGEPYSLGLESDIKTLPRTPESSVLLPGSSVIVIRFDNAGELMAARSWRDEKDDWRSSCRWVLTQRADDNDITLGIRDTEYLLAPQVMAPNDDRSGETYNLLSVPAHPYYWSPRLLSQSDNSLVRKKQR